MTPMATSTSSPSASCTERARSPSLPSRTARSARIFPALAVAAVLATATSAAPPLLAADPTIGDCLQAAEASLKLRADHKLRLTRTQLLVCSSPSCPAEVRQECMKRIDDVNAAAPTIVLTVKSAALHELTAVKVSVDGQVVADHLDGSALSIDPGAHEFKFESPGAPPAIQTIILHEGEKDRRETVVLGGSTAPSGAERATPEPDATNDTDSETPSIGAGKAQRTVGLVASGVGVAGVALGAVFGILASSAWKSAQRECPGHAGCSTAAMNDRSSAVTDATVSTVGFIAGGAVLAGGLTLFFTAPKGGSPRVGLEARPGGFAITGGF
jgi:hypothetical protein